MDKLYVSLIIELCSLLVIIAAAIFWAATGVDTRHNYRDEQTLIGGMIWSQFIIPLGLIISTILREDLDLFVHSYYLLSGVAMCGFTGVVLFAGEYKAMKRNETLREQLRDTAFSTDLAIRHGGYNMFYFIIGILSLVAGSFTLADFLLLHFY